MVFMPTYQFTMFSSKGKAPVATTIDAESRLEFAKDSNLRIKAMKQICVKRNWRFEDLKSYGYTSYKVRPAKPPMTKPTGTI